MWCNTADLERVLVQAGQFAGGGAALDTMVCQLVTSMPHLAEMLASHFFHYLLRLVNLLAAERAMDTVVWQLAASVAIPGYTIHTIVAIAHSLLAHVRC